MDKNSKSELIIETTKMSNLSFKHDTNFLNFENTTNINVKPKNHSRALDYFYSLKTFFYLILICAACSLVFTVFDAREKKWRCLYLLIVMVVCYVTTFTDLVMLSFFPLILGTVLMIMPFQVIAIHYITTTTILYVTASIVAGILTRVGLDRRFALFIMRGCSMHLFDVAWRFALISTLLSMFFSDTAAMTLLIPIINQLQPIITYSQNRLNVPGVSDPRLFRPPPSNTSIVQLQKILIIIVAYATCIGGMASMIGSTVNMAFMTIWVNAFGDDTPLTFASWFAYGFPCSLITLFLNWNCVIISWEGPRYFFRLWGYLFKRFYYFMIRRDPNKGIKGVEEYYYMVNSSLPSLDPWSFGEFTGLFFFIALLVLLFTRTLGTSGSSGWGTLWPGYTHDSFVTTLVAFITFFVPRYSHREVDFIMEKSPNEFPSRKALLSDRLMDWKCSAKYVNWGVLWIFGGGFAIAEMITATDLGGTIAKGLEALFTNINQFGIVSLVLLASAIGTEFMSSTIVIQIITPILNNLAVKRKINPLFLAFNSVFIAANALLLPIASTSNVLAYQQQNLSVKDFIRSGLLMKILSYFFLIAYIYTFGYSFFNLGEFPQWAENANL